MSCDNCLQSPKGQQQALETVRAEAKIYAVSNEKTMVIYKEGFEFRYCEYGAAIARGMHILEVVSKHH